ncbi:MAG: polysaccharide biosynthesis/export family protein [Vicinamibacterales bacterium]
MTDSRYGAGRTGGGRAGWRAGGRGGWRLLAWGVILGLCPGLVASARAQFPSDFIAYPRNLTDLDTYRNLKNPRQLGFNRMPGLSPDYQLGPGDEVDVTVVGWTPDALNLKISGDGAVTIPLVGSVTLGGLTAEQAEQAIADRLREKQLIKDPEVLIFISSYEAKTIYALGELDRPGEYGVSFQTTLTDLIFMAGGIDFTAARYGYLHRRTSEAPPGWRPTFLYARDSQLAQHPEVAPPGTEVIRIDLQPMIDGGVLDPNIVLRNGDVLYVPRREIDLVYVIGDVVNAGAFEMPHLRHMTAMQAIAWAGGPGKTARMSEGMLLRYENGARKEFPVDFSAIVNGKRPDMDVQPNDVIFLPSSNAKELGLGLLGVVPRILTLGLFGF